jgi:hypothetical protein
LKWDQDKVLVRVQGEPPEADKFLYVKGFFSLDKENIELGEENSKQGGGCICFCQHIIDIHAIVKCMSISLLLHFKVGTYFSVSGFKFYYCQKLEPWLYLLNGRYYDFDISHECPL